MILLSAERSSRFYFNISATQSRRLETSISGIRFETRRKGNRRGSAMLLRDHPLMSRNGVPNWPPSWTWIRGGRDRHPKGELGTLKGVLPSRLRPEDRCFLLMAYHGAEYLGCLLFDDRTFCKHITGVLLFCCNRRIRDIGNLDLTYT